jgi:hypothetical protein
MNKSAELMSRADVGFIALENSFEKPGPRYMDAENELWRPE